jgi:hypothetical protein
VDSVNQPQLGRSIESRPLEQIGVLTIASDVAAPQADAILRVQLSIPSDLGPIAGHIIQPPKSNWTIQVIGVGLPSAEPGLPGVPDNLAGYFYRVVYFRDTEKVERWTSIAHPLLTIPTDFELTFGLITQDHVLQVWSWRAIHAGSPVFSEIRWHPTLGLAKWIGVTAGDPHPTSEEAEQASRGFEVLRDLKSAVGYPPGPVKNDRDAERRAVLEETLKLRRPGFKLERETLRTQIQEHHRDLFSISSPSGLRVLLNRCGYQFKWLATAPIAELESKLSALTTV